MRIHGFIEAAENGRCEAVQHALRSSSSGNTPTCPSFCIRISSLAAEGALERFELLPSVLRVRREQDDS